MKLILSQAEIEVAINKHIFETITLREDQIVTIDFTAGRGESGLTATVDIPYMGVASVDLSIPLNRVEQVEELPVVETTSPVRRGPKPKAVAKSNPFVTGEVEDAADAVPVATDLEAIGQVDIDQDDNQVVAEEVSAPPATEKPKGLFNP